MSKTPELKIIFEDDDILAIDKPSGMVVNRSDTYSGYTLQDYVNENYDINEDFEEESSFDGRSGIVHRLDKDTSGIIIISKNQKSFENLQKQFKNREVQKEYKAIVIGKVENKVIEINAPIKRHPRFPFKFAVVEGGRDSLTNVALVKNFELEGQQFSSLAVYPKTGRTHQIRVHLSAMNHSIVHDEIYCSKSQLDLSVKYFNRLMLHAFNITFSHPTTGVKVLLGTQLPQDFAPYF